MNNVNQSNDSILVDEDDTYDEYLEEEVLYVERASGDPGCWKMENAEHYNITVHFRRTIQKNNNLQDYEM